MRRAVAERPQNSDDTAWYYALAQLGTEMVAPIAVGVILDYQLEPRFPWFTVSGAVLGFVGGMVHLVRVVKRRSGKRSGGGPSSPAASDKEGQ